MKSIVLIGCYFGKLRKDANMFKKSVEANPTINWLIFSDCDWGSCPQNMNVVIMGFEELREIVQKNFDFKISLNSPYKLCDFRPAYGEIFHSYIKQFDFWGHCDFDMIFGNLRNFFTEDKLEKYSRIYYQGHLSIYLNSKEVNSLYKSNKGRLYYRDVFSTSKPCVFDEVDGMYPIFIAEKIPMYTYVEYADIFPYLNVLLHCRNEYRIEKTIPRNYSRQVFCYDNGEVYKLFKKGQKVCREEFAYIHFSHKEYISIETNRFYFSNKGLVPFEKNSDICFGHYYIGLDDFKMYFAEFIFRFKRKITKLKNRILD